MTARNLAPLVPASHSSAPTAAPGVVAHQRGGTASSPKNRRGAATKLREDSVDHRLKNRLPSSLHSLCFSHNGGERRERQCASAGVRRGCKQPTAACKGASQGVPFYLACNPMYVRLVLQVAFCWSHPRQFDLQLYGASLRAGDQSDPPTWPWAQLEAPTGLSARWRTTEARCGSRSPSGTRR